MKVESLRSIFPPERKKRKKTFRVTFRVSISIRLLLAFGKKSKTRYRKRRRTKEQTRRTRNTNEPGRVVLPNTRRDQVLPDHVVFNYRRVRVRGTFLEEVLLFSLSLSLFVLKRRHHLGGIFGIKSMFTHLL
jgi:hypothetical protein